MSVEYLHEIQSQLKLSDVKLPKESDKTTAWGKQQLSVLLDPSNHWISKGDRDNRDVAKLNKMNLEKSVSNSKKGSQLPVPILKHSKTSKLKSKAGDSARPGIGPEMVSKTEIFPSDRPRRHPGDLPTIITHKNYEIDGQGCQKPQHATRSVPAESLGAIQNKNGTEMTRMRIRDALPRINEKFTLYPSLGQGQGEFLDRGDKKKIEMRTKVAKVIEEDLRHSMGPPVKSKLIITKQFQFFPNRSGDHHICYFSIENKSKEIQGYCVTSSRPSSFSIMPPTAYVPPGRTYKVCLKAIKGNITSGQLESDYIIIKSFVPLTEFTVNTDLAEEFERLEKEKGSSPLCPVTKTCFPLKKFVLHPCSVVSSRATHYNSLAPEFPLEPPPLPPCRGKCRRLQKLRNRNFGEKVFDRVQTAAAVSLKELEICQRRAQIIGSILSLITYVIFISTLAFAGYLCVFGAKLKEPPPGTSVQDGSHVNGWKDRVSSLFTNFNFNFDFYSWLTTGFETFVKHPLAFCAQRINGWLGSSS